MSSGRDCGRAMCVDTKNSLGISRASFHCSRNSENILSLSDFLLRKDNKNNSSDLTNTKCFHELTTQFIRARDVYIIFIHLRLVISLENTFRSFFKRISIIPTLSARAFFLSFFNSHTRLLLPSQASWNMSHVEKKR